MYEHELFNFNQLYNQQYSLFSVTLSPNTFKAGVAVKRSNNNF